jgi:hypothetical protein
MGSRVQFKSCWMVHGLRHGCGWKVLWLKRKQWLNSRCFALSMATVITRPNWLWSLSRALNVVDSVGVGRSLASAFFNVHSLV